MTLRELHEREWRARTSGSTTARSQMASSLQPATDVTLTSVAPFACRKHHTEMGQPPATLEGQIWRFFCRWLPTDHPKPL